MFFKECIFIFAGNADKPHKSCLSGYVSQNKCSICLQNSSTLSYQYCPVHSASEPSDSGLVFSLKPILIYLKCRKGAVSSYIHPFINKKLLQIIDGVPLEDVICEINLNILLRGVWYGCSNFLNIYKPVLYNIFGYMVVKNFQFSKVC